MSAGPMERLLARLADPPAEYGVWPFWFWNDDLLEAELLRQLHAFHAAGAGGVVIHPRLGLSARVGYLTPEYLRLVRRVVDECAALGLGVLLYDEGSYPSGSAAGRVVDDNPAHASRALVRVTQRLDAPHRGYWRPAVNRSLDHHLVCVTLARLRGETATAVEPESVRVLEPLDHNLVRVEVAGGRWIALACFDVPSGGVIRGVLPQHEDDAATAPPAGDIMNPDAVASFIRLTHDAYARAPGHHIGTTVVGVFTDEPSPLGRRARRDAWPYTAGFDGYIAERLGWPIERVRAHLPALWVDYGPAGDAFRRAYTTAVERRVGEVFYGAQAAWCRAHGVALTGHPHASNDMASLARFDWPGQDAVWRWVLPPGADSNTSGLEGAHSVSAKAATSAARARPPGQRTRTATELFGAYGWRLTLDEAKWLIDWHLVRGNNLFIPHAVFYSVRGARAFESEPDVGLHNVWWPHFQRLMRYTRALSWLLTDSEHVCDVAILGTGHDLPWRAARTLYETQIDFLYVDDAALAASTVRGDRLVCGSQAYRVVVRDGDVALSRRALSHLSEFTAAGGTLLDAGSTPDVAAAVRAIVPADAHMAPGAPGLRVIHVRNDGHHAYLVTNEGEASVEGALTVSVAGAIHLLDPLRGTTVAVPRDSAGAIRLQLGRRESRLLLVDTSRTEAASFVSPPHVEIRSAPLVDWTVAGVDGSPALVTTLGDWCAVPDLDRLSGTLVYSATFHLSSVPRSAAIDLGQVGDAA
ncbi:MAG TPA: hypothetical protein VFX49_15735, partial [Chloroflexota bacterium]|nr:hypothetical protein [Chloroflexota bacterium]